MTRLVEGLLNGKNSQERSPGIKEKRGVESRDLHSRCRKGDWERPFKQKLEKKGQESVLAANSATKRGSVLLR